jgi:hypothetical protein
MGINLKPVSASSVFQSAFPERFKPKQGEGYRLWLPEIENLYRAKTHYLRPNYVFCLQAPENGINKPCPVCQQGEYARFRYGMNVVVYKTDSTGKLRPVVKNIDGKDVDTVDWEVKLWLFSQTAANDLYTITSMYENDKEWAFKHDIKLLCIDDTKGKYSIQAYPDSVFQTRAEAQDLILASLKAGRRDPVKELGVLQTETEMLQAIASGALQKRDKKDAPQLGRPAARFPVSEVRESAYASPSVIAPKEGHSPADKVLADEVINGNRETTREIGSDKEFDELLAKIKNQAKK